MAATCQAGRAVVPGNRAVIFVTVGAQMPFDRLVKTVDQWAIENSRDDVFAQIGQSEYHPSHMLWTKFLDPDEFKRKYDAATVIVAHAGTGSIITALQLGKPILVMPRRAKLRETRNDHQIATSKKFLRFDSVEVAWDENELLTKLTGIDKLRGSQRIASHASSELVMVIREFIERC